MFLEKKWASIPTILLTANSTVKGVLTVADTRPLKVKQEILLKSNTQANTVLQVKRVTSKTTFEVGLSNENITQREDVSMFTVADSASFIANEQPRPKIGKEDFERAVYAEEPIGGIRSILVDEFGEYYNADNPFAVNAQVDSVQLLDKKYDSGTETYPSSSQEIVTTYLGGLSGTPVQRVTLNYTDATKNTLINFQREQWNGSSWVVG